MDEKKDIVNSLLVEDDVDKILDEAVTCTAELEVGEVAKLLLGFFQRLPNMKFYNDLCKTLFEDQKEDLDDFTFNLMMSLIMTVLDNYQKREKKTAVA